MTCVESEGNFSSPRKSYVFLHCALLSLVVRGWPSQLLASSGLGALRNRCVCGANGDVLGPSAADRKNFPSISPIRTAQHLDIIKVFHFCNRARFLIYILKPIFCTKIHFETFSY